MSDSILPVSSCFVLIRLVQDMGMGGDAEGFRPVTRAEVEQTLSFAIRARRAPPRLGIAAR